MESWDGLDLGPRVERIGEVGECPLSLTSKKICLLYYILATDCERRHKKRVKPHASSILCNGDGAESYNFFRMGHDGEVSYPRRVRADLISILWALGANGRW
jgi:hypothetical protein